MPRPGPPPTNTDPEKLDILHRVLRHNFRNSTNSILSNAVSLQEFEDPQYRTSATIIEEGGQESIDRSKKARKAQNHLDIPPDQDCQVDLMTLSKHALRKFGIANPRASVSVDGPESAPALASPWFELVVFELLENGVRHHQNAPGPVAVTVEREGDEMVVSVLEECDPIPSSIIETIERGKEGQLNHTGGLGLRIVRWVADTVGADLEFDRLPDDTGNAVRLRFDALDVE